MQIYNFDAFEYSVAVLFVIFMLIVFIGILWYNTLHRQINVDYGISKSKGNKGNNNKNNDVKCIPQPSKLLGESKYY